MFPLWKRPSSYTSIRSKRHEHFWTNPCLCWLKIDMESSSLYLGAAVITNLLQHDKRYQCTALKLSLFAAVAGNLWRTFVLSNQHLCNQQSFSVLISHPRLSLFLSCPCGCGMRCWQCDSKLVYMFCARARVSVSHQHFPAYCQNDISQHEERATQQNCIVSQT